MVKRLLTFCESCEALLCLWPKTGRPKAHVSQCADINTINPNPWGTFKRQIDGVIWRSAGCDDAHIVTLTQECRVIGPSSRKWTDLFLMSWSHVYCYCGCGVYSQTGKLIEVPAQFLFAGQLFASLNITKQRWGLQRPNPPEHTILNTTIFLQRKWLTKRHNVCRISNSSRLVCVVTRSSSSFQKSEAFY